MCYCVRLPDKAHFFPDILLSMAEEVSVTQKSIKEKLLTVMDPEMNLSIIDLGLVYKITIHKKGNVHILMTLTSMGCPLFGIIEEDVYLKLSHLGLARKQIAIEVTFEPPWTPDRMSRRAKIMLGI